MGGLLTLTSLVAFVSDAAFAACSPGIPCTDYDIYNNPDAATDPALNGPKSGEPLVSGSHENGACDANFMNQIYARAYMEANREVIMSQQIIHKPDSVLEYTCFDKFVSVAANNIDNIFSATTDWENRNVNFITSNEPSDSTLRFTNYTVNRVFPDDQLDNILELLILEDLETYITNNFSHSFLGEAISIDNDMNTGAIGSGNYECSHMATVWNMAKCIDFGEDDKFRSFEHLVSNDPRSIPLSCPATAGGTTPTTNISDDSVIAGDGTTQLDSTNAGEALTIGALPAPLTFPGLTVPFVARMPSGGLSEECPAAAATQTGLYTGVTNDLIRVANNCDLSDTEPNAYSRVDLMQTYTELTKGVGAYLPGVGNIVASGIVTGAVLCAPPIPTGVPVYTYTHDSVNIPGFNIDAAFVITYFHNDHICPNPGCFYQPIKQPYRVGDPLPTVTNPGFCLPIP